MGKLGYIQEETDYQLALDDDGSNDVVESRMIDSANIRRPERSEKSKSQANIRSSRGSGYHGKDGGAGQNFKQGYLADSGEDNGSYFQKCSQKIILDRSIRENKMKRLDNLVQESLERERLQYKQFSGMLGRFTSKANVAKSQQNLKRKEDEYLTFLNKNYPV